MTPYLAFLSADQGVQTLSNVGRVVRSSDLIPWGVSEGSEPIMRADEVLGGVFRMMEIREWQMARDATPRYGGGQYRNRVCETVSCLQLIPFRA